MKIYIHIYRYSGYDLADTPARVVHISNDFPMRDV